MRKPNKNKMAGVNSRFASVSELIFNGFLLKMLRSLSVYILKQLFFSISVNSGRIFTSSLRCSVNILPLFTLISKNNCQLFTLKAAWIVLHRVFLPTINLALQSFYDGSFTNLQTNQ